MTADLITTIPCHARTVRGLAEPVVFIQDGHVFASSEDIATFFGKQHSHVMRDIRTLISNNNSCASKFGFTSRPVPMPAGGTREVATCNMSRDGFTLLAMGFTGKRALAWKLQYIEAFNIMEAALSRKPAKRSQANPYRNLPLIDQLDASLDILLTCETALYSSHGIERKEIEAIRSAMGTALRMMTPVRAFVNDDI